MYNLFVFLWKRHNFLLFILLEIIAIILTIRESIYHKALFFGFTSEITNQLTVKYSEATEYIALKDIYQKAIKENVRLKNQNIKNYIINDSNTFRINDTTYKQQYKYLAAKVINNTVNQRSNYITLDKGAIHNIKPGMAIINSDGVVGIVKDVSKNFSLAISLLNKETKISSKVKHKGFIGSLVWEGRWSTMATLNDIPVHVKIRTGDTIVTSGFSTIFPEGIPIGVIYFYKEIPGGNFYNIDVKLLTDFSNLNYVYVIYNIFKEEQDNLEKKNIVETK